MSDTALYIFRRQWKYKGTMHEGCGCMSVDYKTRLITRGNFVFSLILLGICDRSYQLICGHCFESIIRVGWLNALIFDMRI